jgi:hypothetical protein
LICVADVVVCVILNDFLILLPVIVRLTIHEAVGRPIDVLLLGKLKLGLLLLAGHAWYGAQHNSLDSVTTAIIQWFVLASAK